MTSKVCPRCNKPRPTIKVEEKDSTTGKYWRVEKCFACHFNFDLEECTRAIDSAERIKNWTSRFREDAGGWTV